MFLQVAPGGLLQALGKSALLNCLRVGLFLLTGKSFLLTVALCCLRSIGLVFFVYS